MFNFIATKNSRIENISISQHVVEAKEIERYRQEFITAVDNIDIKSVLNIVLHQKAPIALNIIETDDLIRFDNADIRQSIKKPITLYQLFIDAQTQNQLFIQGVAGAGKTTALLELTQNY